MDMYVCLSLDHDLLAAMVTVGRASPTLGPNSRFRTLGRTHVAANLNRDSIAAPTSTFLNRKNSHVRLSTLGTSSQPTIQVFTPSALNLLLAEATILAKHIQILYRTFFPILTPFT